MACDAFRWGSPLTLGALFGALLFTLGCPQNAAPPAKTEYYCPMHPEIVSDQPGSCPICYMDLVPKDLASARTAAASPPEKDQEREPFHPPAPLVQPKPGELPAAEPPSKVPEGFVVPVVSATRESVQPLFRVSGSVRVDEERVYRLETRAAGWIVELPASVPGRRVRRGERLAVFESPELWQVEAEWQLAVRSSEQWRQQGSASLAQAGGPLLGALRQRLLWLGIPLERLEELAAGNSPSGRLTLTAPFDGYLLEVPASRGMWVERGTPVAKLARLDRVFLEASLFEADLPWLRPGIRAQVYVAGRAEPLREPAVLDFLEPIVEAETRTVRARFRWSSPPEFLLPGQVLTLEVQAPASEPVVTVPEEAVLPTGSRFLVFLDAGEGRFVPREVQPGVRVNGRIAIHQGLAAGERVAARAAFLLDSESRIRGRLEPRPSPHAHGSEPPKEFVP